LKQAIAPVISNSKVMPDAHLIWLESPQIADIARPGQFVMVQCGKDTLLRRPLSVHQANGDKMALLFEIVGKGTQWLSQRQAGDTVDILGPLGNGYTIRPHSKNLLLVAGGIGIAPLNFLALEALRGNHSIKLLYGTADNKRYSPPSQIELVEATEDGTVGYKGKATELIPRYIDWADQIFACGPLAMYKTMTKMPELKDRPVQISLEMRMGCGRGVCFGCTVKTKSGLKQVCKDGPIFDLDDILWHELA